MAGPGMKAGSPEWLATLAHLTATVDSEEVRSMVRELIGLYELEVRLHAETQDALTESRVQYRDLATGGPR